MQEVYYVSDFSEGLVRVSIGGKWGNVRIPRYIPTFDLLKGSGGYWGNETKELYSGGKWGFVDKTGKEVIPLIYNSAGDFRNGLAEVKLNGEKFYINKKGERVNR